MIVVMTSLDFYFRYLFRELMPILLNRGEIIFKFKFYDRGVSALAVVMRGSLLAHGAKTGRRAPLAILSNHPSDSIYLHLR